MSRGAGFVPRGITPSEEQRAVLLARDRLVVVEANAGAAKTTTLACRIGEALAAGTLPEAILALTYTDAAVAALRLAMDRIGVEPALGERLPVRTFDDFAADRLRRDEGPDVRRLRTPEEVRPHVLRAIQRATAQAAEHPDAAPLGPLGETSVEGLLDAFFRLKGSMRLAVGDAAGRNLTPALADEIGEDYPTLLVLRAFEELRWEAAHGRFGHRFANDATYDLATRLRDDDAFVAEDALLPEGIALLLVDEMHDVNRAMFTVLDRLLRVNPGAHFVGVGDRDQVLHRLAGADARFMGSDFDRQIGTPRRLPLTATYRFGGVLAEASGRLARKPYRSARGAAATRVTLVPCRAVPADVDGHGARDARAEQTRRIVAALGERDGLPPRLRPSEVAVLLRHPHQSILVEDALLSTGTNYAVAGFLPYLQRREIHFVRGLLAHAVGGFATIALPATRRAVLEEMLRFTASAAQPSGAELDRLAADPTRIPAFVDHQVLRLAEPASRRRVEAALACLGSGTGVPGLADRFTAALDARHIASRVLVAADEVERVGRSVRLFMDTTRGYDSIESYLRVLSEHEAGQGRGNRRQQYLLASIEAVKGHEFEHVLVPDLNAVDFDGSAGDRDEDRNLFYVAITRAKSRLTIFYDPARPSRLLVESGLLKSG